MGPADVQLRRPIVDGKAVTASLYKTGTRKHYDGQVDERILAYAERRAKEFCPARAYVLDVFEAVDDPHAQARLYIGEVNNFNSAGFYAADMQKLIGAVEAMEGF